MRGTGKTNDSFVHFTVWEVLISHHLRLAQFSSVAANILKIQSGCNHFLRNTHTHTYSHPCFKIFKGLKHTRRPAPGCSHTYHICERELSSLRYNVSVDGHHGTTIVVDTVSVTAPLVGIQIHTSTLEHQPEAKCSSKSDRFIIFITCAVSDGVIILLKQHCPLVLQTVNGNKRSFYFSLLVFTLPHIETRCCLLTLGTLNVADLTRLTLWSALRSSWWLADELVKISTPSSPI